MKETKSSIRLSFSPDGSGYRVKAYSGKMESKKIQVTRFNVEEIKSELEICFGL